MLVGNQLFLKYEIEIKLSLMLADYVFSQTSKFLQFEDWVSLVGTKSPHQFAAVKTASFLHTKTI